MYLAADLILVLSRVYFVLEYPLQLCRLLGLLLKPLALLCSVALLSLFASRYLMRRKRNVYLVDFACYIPNPSNKLTTELFMDKIISSGSYTQENIEFQRKVLEKSGLGPNETYIHEALHCKPPKICMEEARKEAEIVLVGAIDDLLEKTGVNPSDIGILVLNSSVFNPAPSLSSMLANHYNLREDILSFNLTGMGCSASHISIHLAQNLLQVHKDTYALIVSAETINLNWYLGSERSMLISNCIFRMGGAAILLSNKQSDQRRSKYKLNHILRTHTGSDDKSYNCVFQKEDNNGKLGISLSKDLMVVAGEALKRNIKELGPLVLPISEQLRYLFNMVSRRVFGSKMDPYVPDFKLAFEHFCIHTGGRGVLDEMEKKLNLSEWQMEPSRMTLYRFGNMSSCSVWYELAYIETKGRMKKGDRTWQIGFGSGFKCNSVVWLALKDIDHANWKEKNPWMGEVKLCRD